MHYYHHQIKLDKQLLSLGGTHVSAVEWG